MYLTQNTGESLGLRWLKISSKQDRLNTFSVAVLKREHGQLQGRLLTPVNKKRHGLIVEL